MQTAPLIQTKQDVVQEAVAGGNRQRWRWSYVETVKETVIKSAVTIQATSSGSTSAGYPGQQDRPGGAGALPTLPPVPPPAAGHPLRSVQHLGQYGYDHHANVPTVYDPATR